MSVAAAKKAEGAYPSALLLFGPKPPGLLVPLIFPSHEQHGNSKRKKDNQYRRYQRNNGDQKASQSIHPPIVQGCSTILL